MSNFFDLKEFIYRTYLTNTITALNSVKNRLLDLEKPVPKNEFFKIEFRPVVSPYKGRIVTEEKITVFGFSIPHKKTLCIIDEHGIVTSSDGSGWIDNQGQIHRRYNGRYEWGYQKEIAGIIKGDELYLKNIRVGKWESD